MPRKTKCVKGAKAEMTLPENDPQPTLTGEQAEAKQATKTGRGVDGKFTQGNSFGPGNPHARHCARMLDLFRNAISDQEMGRLFRKLFEKAEAGDVSAAKLIISYKIGKPLPAPHPDAIDRDEWDHYRKDAMNDKEMAVVMNALPTRVGNDVARVTLPIMTAARVNELAVQLCEGIPAQEKRDEEFGAKDDGHDEKSAPLPNGKMNVPDQLSTLYPSRTTTEKTIHDSRPSTKAADKKMKGKKIQKNSRAQIEKESNSCGKDSPLANGKKGNERADASRGKPDSTIPHPRLKNVHDPRFTTTPLPNRKLDQAQKSKNKRNKAKALWLQPLAKQLKGTCS